MKTKQKRDKAKESSMLNHFQFLLFPRWKREDKKRSSFDVTPMACRSRFLWHQTKMVIAVICFLLAILFLGIMWFTEEYINFGVSSILFLVLATQAKPEKLGPNTLALNFEWRDFVSLVKKHRILAKIVEFDCWETSMQPTDLLCIFFRGEFIRLSTDIQYHKRIESPESLLKRLRIELSDTYNVAKALGLMLPPYEDVISGTSHEVHPPNTMICNVRRTLTAVEG